MRLSVLATIFATLVTLVVAIPIPPAGKASMSVVLAVETPASSSVLPHHATLVRRKTPADESRSAPKHYEKLRNKHDKAGDTQTGQWANNMHRELCRGNIPEHVNLKAKFWGGGV